MMEQSTERRVQRFIETNDSGMIYNPEVLKVVEQNGGNCPCRSSRVPCPCSNALEDIQKQGQCRCGLIRRGVRHVDR